MAPAQLEQLEKALDVAQRVLNERVELARQMAKDAEGEGRSTGVWYWERVRAEAEQQADAIRQVLVDCTGPEHEAGDASD